MIHELSPLTINSANVISILTSSGVRERQDIKVITVFKGTQTFLFYVFLALDPFICALPTPGHSILGFSPLFPGY